MQRIEETSHCQTNDAVGGIKEADVPCIDTAFRWNPREDEKVDVDSEREYYYCIPCSELGGGCTDACTAFAHEE